MILKDDDERKYCSKCKAWHCFPNLTKEGKCRYCEGGEE